MTKTNYNQSFSKVTCPDTSPNIMEIECKEQTFKIYLTPIFLYSCITFFNISFIHTNDDISLPKDVNIKQVCSLHSIFLLQLCFYINMVVPIILWNQTLK